MSLLLFLNFPSHNNVHIIGIILLLLIDIIPPLCGETIFILAYYRHLANGILCRCCYVPIFLKYSRIIDFLLTASYVVAAAMFLFAWNVAHVLKRFLYSRMIDILLTASYVVCCYVPIFLIAYCLCAETIFILAYDSHLADGILILMSLLLFQSFPRIMSAYHRIILLLIDFIPPLCPRLDIFLAYDGILLPI